MRDERTLGRRGMRLLLCLGLVGCAAQGDVAPRQRTSDLNVVTMDPDPSATGAAGSAPTTPTAADPTAPVDTGMPCAAGDTCTPEQPPDVGMAGAGDLGAAGSAAQPGDALDPTQPTCFEFHNHGQPVSGDTSKYAVITGEHYLCNHYTVPWHEPAELVSWSTLYDNKALPHHWLLYSVPGGAVDGAFEPCIGTHLLQDAQLVAGWAVGGNDVTLPEDIGLRMPGAERSFLLEWHYYNTTGAVQMDSTGMSICVLPAGTRPNTAGMTWLGTENFNGPAGMPAGQMSNFSGTCVNDSGAPIHIFRFWPHMHKWGRQMTSVVTRAGSLANEEVFKMPFDFNYQVSYDAGVELMPGDSITSTCTFNNMSLSNVAFGPSTDQEMCYQFAFSYPAGALDNGIPSLVGATNTCW